MIWHHLLVVKVIDDEHVWVIHYTDSLSVPQNSKYKESSCAVNAIGAVVSNRTYDAAQVVEQLRTVIVKEEVVQVLWYPRDVIVYKGEEAVERARSKLGEQEYSLVYNNCEHFVNWVVTDRSESSQIKTAGKMAAASAAVFSVAFVSITVGVAAILYKLYGASEVEGD